MDPIQCSEFALAGGAILIAYHATYSPAARVKAVNRNVAQAMELNEKTLEEISEFPTDDQAEFKDAKDQRNLLFDAMVRAHQADQEVQNAPFVRRHCIPTFTFEQGTTLGELEEEVTNNRENVIATSVKTKKRKEEIKAATQEEQSAAQPQPAHNQYSQPRTSWDVDLETGDMARHC